MSRPREVPLSLLLLLCCACLQAFSSEPKKCDSQNDDDDCLDAIMHPDLSPVSSRNNERSHPQSDVDTNDYWLQLSKEALRERGTRKPNFGKAKNVILFLGDGMGLTTITAARTQLGGEERRLSFETFAGVGLAKTYSVDRIVPDSACTATAYLGGVKGNLGTIGLNGNVPRYDCDSERQRLNEVNSIAKWALDAGKAAGLVTTTRVTHASPAGVYAHIADRDWENDAALKAACGNGTRLQDIAYQLIHGDVGRRLKVVMGGGRSEFVDPALGGSGAGNRRDGRNLIKEFQAQQSEENVYVETFVELVRVNISKTNRLLGLFHNSHLDYHAQATEPRSQPTLEQMTKKAIAILRQERNGFFLFIEGGSIDLAHHETKARLALDETLEFSKAISLARRMTSEEDTLIVVTADHSHTFSIAGYQSRGGDIFGIAPTTATDERKYLALSYANGPSFGQYYDTQRNRRRDPEEVISNQPNATFPSTAPFVSETHGGEDVAVFASGPWDQLFSGNYEQNAIPHMMAYAACLGNGLKACK